MIPIMLLYVIPTFIIGVLAGINIYFAFSPTRARTFYFSSLIWRGFMAGIPLGLALSVIWFYVNSLFFVVFGVTFILIASIVLLCLAYIWKARYLKLDEDIARKLRMVFVFSNYMSLASVFMVFYIFYLSVSGIADDRSIIVGIFVACAIALIVNIAIVSDVELSAKSIFSIFGVLFNVSVINFTYNIFQGTPLIPDYISTILIVILIFAIYFFMVRKNGLRGNN